MTSVPIDSRGLLTNLLTIPDGGAPIGKHDLLELLKVF